MLVISCRSGAAAVELPHGVLAEYFQLGDSVLSHSRIWFDC